MNDDDKFSEMDRRDRRAMSDNTPKSQDVAQLWPDERVNDLIKFALSDQPNHTPRGLVRRVSYTIRDEYEAKLAEYQAVYAYYIDLAEKTEARIAELEAQIAKLQISLRAAHEENMALIDELDGDDEQ